MNIFQRPPPMAKFTMDEDLYVFFTKNCKRDSVMRDHTKQVKNALKPRNHSKSR